MSDYTLQVTWSTKDAISTGEQLKAISATELGNEFSAILTAVNSKYDSTDRDVANGLCPIDANSLVPVGNLPAATDIAVGVLEIATDDEATTGAAVDKWLTPANLQAVLDQNGAYAEDITTLSAPGADRILFQDGAATNLNWLAVSTGLTLTGTNLTSDDSAIVHDNLSGFVANEHIDHSGVSVITASAGLAAVNDDLTSNIGLSIDVSTLAEFTATGAVDLDADYVILDDDGTEKKALVAPLLTPEVDTADFTTATEAITAANFGKLVSSSHGGAVTVTLPNSLKAGFWATIYANHASGSIVLTAAGTLNTANSFTTASAAYSSVTVFHLGSNVWTAWGLDS